MQSRDDAGSRDTPPHITQPDSLDNYLNSSLTQETRLPLVPTPDIMDPLSGAASVIAVVQVAGQVWSICWKYYSDAKDAKPEIDRLMAYVLALQNLFQQIEALAGADKLVASKEIIERTSLELEREFKMLQRMLEPGKRQSILKPSGRRLKWPLQKEDVEKIVQLLERHKTTLITAMNCDQMYEVDYSLYIYKTNTLISLGRLSFIFIITERKVVF